MSNLTEKFAKAQYAFVMKQQLNIGDEVKWSWGNGTASGSVEKVSPQKTHIQSKGETITRNGTNDDPAVVIKQDNGTKIIKLASELT